MKGYFRKYNAWPTLQFLWYRKEAFTWIAALVFLAFIDPADHHYTLCPFSNLGWEFCPGCGLGRSIALLYRLDFTESFLCHPLGIPALMLIIHRIIHVLYKANPSFKPTNKQLNYVDTL